MVEARDVLIIVALLFSFVGFVFSAGDEIGLTFHNITGQGNSNYLASWVSSNELGVAPIYIDNTNATYITGNLLIDGDIVDVQSQNISGNVMPSLTGTFSIGNATNTWKDLTIDYQDGIYSTYSVANNRVQVFEVDSGDANTGASSVANVNKFGTGLNGFQLGSATGGFACSNVNPQSCLIRVNNTNAFFFRGNGNVGLGTTTPNTILDVVQNSNAQSQILLNNSNSGTSARSLITARADSGTINLQQTSQAFTVVPAWTNSSILSFSGQNLFIHGTDSDNPDIIFALNGSASTTEVVRIKSAGFLGVNVNPSVELAVKNIGNNSNMIQWIPRVNNGSITWFEDSQGDIWQRVFDASNSENVRIRPDGESWFINNLGIGTNQPIAKLHVNASNTLISSSQTGSDTILSLTADPNNIPEDDTSRIVLSQDGGGTNISVGGIGSNQAEFTGALHNYGALWNNVQGLQFATANISRVVIDSSGNMGIGVSTPSQKLEVVGNANITGNSYLNLFYGSMYLVNETGHTITISATDTYYNITNMTIGFVNGMNFVSPYLNISQKGLYKIDWSVSFSGGANNLYGISVGKNGARQDACYTHRTTTSAGLGNTGASCILNLTTNDRITIVIADEASPSNDAVIYMSNLAMVRVGNN